MGRDEALAALVDRMVRWSRGHDPDEVLASLAWAEVQALYGAFDDPDDDIEACQILGFFHWARWLARPGPHDGERFNQAAHERFGRYQRTGDPIVWLTLSA